MGMVYCCLNGIIASGKKWIPVLYEYMNGISMAIPFETQTWLENPHQSDGA